MTRARVNDMIRRTQTYAILDAGRIDTAGCNPISLLFDSRIWKIRLQADPDNTATVEVGNQWRQPYELVAGAEIEIPIDATSKVYVELTAGDAVNWWVMGTTTPISFPSAYTKKVFDYGPIAYWTQGEQIGLVAYDQINPPAQNGTYIGVTLGQQGIGDGLASPLYDGIADHANVISVPLGAAFNGAEGTIVWWQRVFNVGVWTDGALRYALRLRDSITGRQFLFRKAGAANQFLFRRSDGGGNHDVTVNGLVSTAFDCYALTFSETAGTMSAYINNVLQGAPVAIGAWGVATLDIALIGAASVAGATPWHGYEAHCALFDRVLTAAELAGVATV